MKTFWEMNKNVSRLQAENDLRALRIAQAGQFTAEGLKAVESALRAEMGEVVREKPVLDRAALNALLASLA